MRPFLFNTHFPEDMPPLAKSRPDPVMTGGFTEEDLEAVRDRAFKQGMELGERDGFDRGQQAARQSADAQHAQALAAVEAALRSTLADLAGFQQRLERDSVRVVTALVAKLAPPLLDAVADAELDGLVLETLRAAVGQPVLEIRVAPAAAERLRAEIDGMAATAGFRGSVSVKGDASLPAGAAAADWSTGGAEHNPRLLERQLGDAVAIAISRLTVRSRDAR